MKLTLGGRRRKIPSLLAMLAAVLVAVAGGLSATAAGEDARPQPQATPTRLETGSSSAANTVAPADCVTAAADIVETPEPGRVPRVDRVRAIAALDCLSVKGPAGRSDYSRKGKYGNDWIDTDHNGLDTRTDVLLSSLTDIAYVPGKKKEVASGSLWDPYTGKTIRFLKGSGPNQDGGVQVDHLIALEKAHQTGAGSWTQERRIAFANDRANLILVSTAMNRQKSSSDAASWVPPYKPYRCAYAALQVQVMGTWGLWVTPPAKEALLRYLASC